MHVIGMDAALKRFTAFGCFAEKRNGGGGEGSVTMMQGYTESCQALLRTQISELTLVPECLDGFLDGPFLCKKTMI